MQVLLRLRQILGVTRIFRLMRVLKLFQQYLVSLAQHVMLTGCLLTALSVCLSNNHYDYEVENERSEGVTTFLALQIHRENIKFEEESGIVKGSKLKMLPWCAHPVLHASLILRIKPQQPKYA